MRKFYREFDRNDIRISKFLDGLEKESKEYALFVISTIEKLKSSQCLNVEVFDKQTAKRDELFIKKFTDEIISCDDATYKYKDYRSVNKFSMSVFATNHSLDSLSTKENINGRNIIDVGGFIGDSAMVFRKNFSDSKIYSFEALPSNIKNFEKNLELNNISNIEIVPIALGDKCGKTFISESASASTISDSENNSVKIEMCTLDAYIEKNNIEDVALIKVDIEGFEQNFIHGARNTIKKYKPTLMLSIYHNWNDFVEIKPLIESLEADYTFKLVKPTDGAFFLETLLICETK